VGVRARKIVSTMADHCIRLGCERRDGLADENTVKQGCCWKMACTPLCVELKRTMTDLKRSDELGAPRVVDRSTFHAELDALRVREKAHTREGDAIAAARRRLLETNHASWPLPRVHRVC
jgi:hypothetical protein